MILSELRTLVESVAAGACTLGYILLVQNLTYKAQRHMVDRQRRPRAWHLLMPTLFTPKGDRYRKLALTTLIIGLPFVILAWTL